jgi:hypothetical protein
MPFVCDGTGGRKTEYSFKRAVFLSFNPKGPSWTLSSGGQFRRATTALPRAFSVSWDAELEGLGQPESDGVAAHACRAREGVAERQVDTVLKLVATGHLGQQIVVAASGEIVRTTQRRGNFAVPGAFCGKQTARQVRRLVFGAIGTVEVSNLGVPADGNESGGAKLVHGSGGIVPLRAA